MRGGLVGAVQAHSAKICLMHSLNSGACAVFSQGYRRGLCGEEEQEKESMQLQKSTCRPCSFQQILNLQLPIYDKTCMRIKNITSYTVSSIEPALSSITAGVCCSEKQKQHAATFDSRFPSLLGGCWDLGHVSAAAPLSPSTTQR